MDLTYKVLGGMAGSSMDGLDLALVKIFCKHASWDYELLRCETIPYPHELEEKLKAAPSFSMQEKKDLDGTFGNWIGKHAREFLSGSAIDLAAIHGHTVTHQPSLGISWQLGSGESIANILQTPTITDFRTKDIHLGGQGAPLVPYGDYTLFSKYDACLNLGGICNISLRSTQLAWDIAPCNQVLNHFAESLGKPYDAEGQSARLGTIDPSFLDELQAVPYFQQEPPKSLPNQFLRRSLDIPNNPFDGLYTYIEFLSDLIKSDLNTHIAEGKLLVTGGGARNTYLMERIQDKLTGFFCEVPEEPLLSFKEALIFAFLGLKRYRNEINVLSSVTGAKSDSCSGMIHLPK